MKATLKWRQRDFAAAAAAGGGQLVQVFFISTPPLRAEEAGTPVAPT